MANPASTPSSSSEDMMDCDDRSGSGSPRSSSPTTIQTAPPAVLTGATAATAAALQQPCHAPVPRACINCGVTRTPLWRNGPKGPKTLCNACGVRANRIAARGDDDELMYDVGDEDLGDNPTPDLASRPKRSRSTPALALLDSNDENNNALENNNTNSHLPSLPATKKQKTSSPSSATKQQMKKEREKVSQLVKQLPPTGDALVEMRPLVCHLVHSEADLCRRALGCRVMIVWRDEPEPPFLGGHWEVVVTPPEGRTDVRAESCPARGGVVRAFRADNAAARTYLWCPALEAPTDAAAIVVADDAAAEATAAAATGGQPASATTSPSKWSLQFPRKRDAHEFRMLCIEAAQRNGFAVKRNSPADQEKKRRTAEAELASTEAMLANLSAARAREIVTPGVTIVKDYDDLAPSRRFERPTGAYIRAPACHPLDAQRPSVYVLDDVDRAWLSNWNQKQGHKQQQQQQQEDSSAISSFEPSPLSEPLAERLLDAFEAASALSRTPVTQDGALALALRAEWMHGECVRAGDVLDLHAHWLGRYETLCAEQEARLQREEEEREAAAKEREAAEEAAEKAAGGRRRRTRSSRDVTTLAAAEAAKEAEAVPTVPPSLTSLYFRSPPPGWKAPRRKGIDHSVSFAVGEVSSSCAPDDETRRFPQQMDVAVQEHQLPSDGHWPKLDELPSPDEPLVVGMYSRHVARLREQAELRQAAANELRERAQRLETAVAHKASRVKAARTSLARATEAAEARAKEEEEAAAAARAAEAAAAEEEARKREHEEAEMALAQVEHDHDVAGFVAPLDLPGSPMSPSIKRRRSPRASEAGSGWTSPRLLSLPSLPGLPSLPLDAVPSLPMDGLDDFCTPGLSMRCPPYVGFGGTDADRL
ncbi:GATA transcription factor [Pseudoscourfieldia marina]